MTQESRLKRLEAVIATSGNAIMAVVPEHWDDEEIQAGIARLIKDRALPTDWEVGLTKDPGCTEERLLFAGNLDALFKHVAKHSSRIGVTKAEAQP